MLITTDSKSYQQTDHEDFFYGWPKKPTYELVMKHFESSRPLFLLNENSDVVGFISVLTDNALYAFIALLEVRKSEQGKGHGKFLVAEMLKSLNGVYAIDLVCDPELEGFYQPFGFTKQVAMSQRHREML